DPEDFQLKGIAEALPTDIHTQIELQGWFAEALPTDIPTQIELQAHERAKDLQRSLQTDSPPARRAPPPATSHRPGWRALMSSQSRNNFAAAAAAQRPDSSPVSDSLNTAGLAPGGGSARTAGVVPTDIFHASGAGAVAAAPGGAGGAPLAGGGVSLVGGGAVAGGGAVQGAGAGGEGGTGAAAGGGEGAVGGEGAAAGGECFAYDGNLTPVKKGVLSSRMLEIRKAVKRTLRWADEVEGGGELEDTSFCWSAEDEEPARSEVEGDGELEDTSFCWSAEDEEPERPGK
ncbi:hypothetical protein T484DRAFT_1825416, partial [Baffinella frigidus]